MDDKQSAMLWQLMQSLGTPTQENHSILTEPPFEHTLISLKPLMAPKQQKIIDLLIKLQEVKLLMEELQAG